MLLTHLLLPDILDLVEAGRLTEVREFLVTQPVPDVAEFLTVLDNRARVLIFRILPRAFADEIFSLLEPTFQNLLLSEMTNEEVQTVLSALPPDDRTALFEELPARVTKSLLALLNDRDRKQALELLSYPESSVGRLMTDRYVKVRPEWTVAQALEHLRRFGVDSETMTMIYITDDHGRLVDDLRLRKLILSKPQIKVADLLDGQCVSLYTLDDREDAIQIFKKYDLYAMPVVDADRVLIGIVTLDDILDVAEEEATEDFHKLAAAQPLQESLRDATIGLLFRKRIGWLLALVGVNIFSGAGISIFEDTIQKVVALVFFLPLLTGSGGNAGAQTSTLMVRAIATGELENGDWWRFFIREIGVSGCIGALMGGAVFLLGCVRGGWHMGVVVFFSMLSVVMMGSLLGILLPKVLDKLRLDPATASSPLIASVADILGILIYFSIATAILNV